MTPTVGFDLDLTLVDASPGVRLTLAELSREFGVAMDADVFLAHQGPPIEQQLARWLPQEKIHPASERFRTLMADGFATHVLALPGAKAAVGAVRAAGGRVVVVTAKREDLARTNLEVVGIEVDELVGWLWGAAKGGALLEHGASVYVGDHPMDVDGARAAGAVSVGVRTGGQEPAGADVVLDDLTSFPGWWEEHLLDTRLAHLDAALKALGSVLVAFSGGADSAFLLAAAVRALGPDRVVAGTGVSPSLAREEEGGAASFVMGLGVRQVTPTTDELARPGYSANGPDRCFHCKATLLDTLVPLAGELGLAAVATGTNADDVRDRFRPGIAAAAGRGARTPLADAGLTKAQVRAASRRWGLPTADKPAQACLASRIAYGVEVTPVALARVERAEVAVRAHLGARVSDLRVRDLGGDTARLEVDEGALTWCDATVLGLVRDSGFTGVQVERFRSGALNEALPG